jgi:hypothetical protein
MLDKRTRFFWVIVVGFAVVAWLLWWWASFGYQTEAYVCEYSKNNEPHCTQHYFVIAIFRATMLWVEKFHESLLVLGTFILLGVVAIQVRDARKSSERQLRAYICMYGGSITLRQLGQQIFLEGYVSLKNFGQTPAYGHSSWIRIDVREAHAAPFAITGNGLTKAIIAPTGEANLPVHHGPVAAQDLLDIRNEAKRIFVWGRSDYIDAFGTPRFFKFYNWNAKELPSGQGWP